MKSLYCVGDVLSGGAQWCEFESEEDAEVYFDYWVFNYVYAKEYRNLYFNSEECDVKVAENYLEAYRMSENGYMSKLIVVQEDEYFIYVKLSGEEEEVEKKSKEFIKEITK